MTSNKKICGLLGLATRAGKTVFGTEACISGLEKKKIKLLIIASDSSNRTKDQFKKICVRLNVPIYENINMDEMSKAIGKDNKAVIGILDVNFSKEVLKIIDGGEVIG